MKLKKTLALSAAAMLTFSLVSCSSDIPEEEAKYVFAYGCEPQMGLVPADTTETCGGKFINNIFSGLMYYEADGTAHNDQAESIINEGNKNTHYTITLKDGLKWSNGEPVTASDYVNSWNFAVANSLTGASFFEPILGYEEGIQEMKGLKVLDKKTFSVELNQPVSDFAIRLGYSAFKPMPKEALTDIDTFGQNPMGNGPYKLAEWEHNVSATLVPNENYEGAQEAKNEGIKFLFYTSLDAAYSDLLAGNLDVLETVPDSAMGSFKKELGDRAVNKPFAGVDAFVIPEYLEHFSGKEGELRRQAISMSINRPELVDALFLDTRTPARDFTSPVIPGYDPDIKGNEVLTYNPEKAKQLWAEADKISPYNDTFYLAYNADGGHQAWVDAVTNQIKNALGIKAEGKPYPDFKTFLGERDDHAIGGAFRSGWSADYPALSTMLLPLYMTNGSSNAGEYSNPEFDQLMNDAAKATSEEEADRLYNDAQQILLRQLPAIPLYYGSTTGGYSENVENVEFAWDREPVLHKITKKGSNQ